MSTRGKTAVRVEKMDDGRIVLSLVSEETRDGVTVAMGEQDALALSQILKRIALSDRPRIVVPPR